MKYLDETNVKNEQGIKPHAAHAGQSYITLKNEIEIGI